MPVILLVMRTTRLDSGINVIVRTSKLCAICSEVVPRISGELQAIRIEDGQFIRGEKKIYRTR